MKNVLILLIAILPWLSCKKSAADKVSEEAAQKAKERAELAKVGFPEMTFETKEFDFGTINEGDKVDAVFEFTNTGKSDLIITAAKASCGCTVPEYEKDKPIKPGEKGVIKAVFNSAGKPNTQNKSITIECNTKNQQEVINIKGFVNPKDGKKSNEIVQ